MRIWTHLGRKENDDFSYFHFDLDHRGITVAIWGHFYGVNF